MRKNTDIHTYSHTHKVFEINSFSRRGVKRTEGPRFVTGLRRAYFSLIYKRKQSPISLQLREERHMRGNGHGWPL